MTILTAAYYEDIDPESGEVSESGYVVHSDCQVTGGHAISQYHKKLRIYPGGIVVAACGGIAEIEAVHYHLRDTLSNQGVMDITATDTFGLDPANEELSGLYYQVILKSIKKAYKLNGLTTHPSTLEDVHYLVACKNSLIVSEGLGCFELADTFISQGSGGIVASGAMMGYYKSIGSPETLTKAEAIEGCKIGVEVACELDAGCNWPNSIAITSNLTNEIELIDP